MLNLTPFQTWTNANNNDSVNIWGRQTQNEYEKHLKLFYTNYIMRTPYTINYNGSMPYDLEINLEKKMELKLNRCKCQPTQ